MNIVTIGGGGGTQQVLRGMLAYTNQLTAILAVTDTGRSTGVARALVGMPAPGDLRSTIAALSFDRTNALAALLDYRLRTEAIPALDGMAVGNLLLAALTQQTGDFAQAVATLQSLAGCAAHVLPASTADTQLGAELADGTLVYGELAVRGLGKPTIRRLFLSPPAQAYPPALEAISRADLVVLGPGSLFTTVLATLLFEGFTEALRTTPATVVYVANTTTQPGQTDRFSPSRHVAALLEQLGPHTLDAVLLNDAPPPADLTALAAADVQPLLLDPSELEAIAALGPRPIARPLAETELGQRQLWNKVDTIRHHPARLGAALYAIMIGEV